MHTGIFIYHYNRYIYCSKNHSVIKDLIFWSHVVLESLLWVLVSSSRTSSWGFSQCQPKLWRVFSSMDILGLQHTVLTSQWLCWDQDKTNIKRKTLFCSSFTLSSWKWRELLHRVLESYLTLLAVNFYSEQAWTHWVVWNNEEVQWRGLKNTFLFSSLTC